MIDPKALLVGAVCPMLMMAACGGGSTPPASATTATPPPTLKGTVGEKLATLVAIGQLPALDRSSTLTGPDADGNGIRDDIDAWIAARQVSVSRRAALVQDAKAMQAIFNVDPADVSAVRLADRSMGRSINCLFDQFDIMDASRFSKSIKSMTMNTRPRFNAYAAHASSLNGKVLPGTEGNTCD